MTDIERNLFHEFCRTFNRATDIGLSQTPHPDDDFRNALRHNNAVFAAFKTHRLQNDVARQLTDSNGNLKTFEQWKNDVHSITSHQCDRWLRTEYDTAVLRARQAANWQQFLREADVLPNLKWIPSTSPNPGKDHRPFWNTILPIAHDFWNHHRPGDRWNCKCELRSTDEQPTAVPNAPMGGSDPQPGLDNNPGIDAKIFADSHPYIANAYQGAQEAVQKVVGIIESIRKDFDAYSTDKWEHSYISKKQNGYVVTELERLKEAKSSKNEQDKFKKEYRMCQVAADNGHRVEFLRGSNRIPGQTYDINLDDVPTDLKSTGSIGNIVKYAKHAYQKQGAQAVLFEIHEQIEGLFDKFREIKRKYDIKVYFYFEKEKVVYEFI